VGSIGVLAQIPNFHRLLDRAGIDFELVKAGEHKRTLTVFGKNTPEDRARMQREIENVHALFKRYVERYRPSLDISGVATGEHWYGPEALERRLVDEIRTSDDYLLDASRTREIYAVNYAERLGLAERLASVVGSSIGRALDRLVDDQTLR
jgi:serine protease SohB